MKCVFFKQCQASVLCIFALLAGAVHPLTYVNVRAVPKVHWERTSSELLYGNEGEALIIPCRVTSANNTTSSRQWLRNGLNLLTAFYSTSNTVSSEAVKDESTTFKPTLLRNISKIPQNSSYLGNHDSQNLIQDSYAGVQFIILSNGSLLIKSLTRTDVGWYQCNTTVTKYAVLGNKIQVKLRENHSTLKSVVKGHPVSLSCCNESDVQYQFMWSKNGEILSQSTRYILLESGVLQILDVNITDEGDYQCNVTSSGDSFSCRNVQLSVHYENTTSDTAGLVWISQPHNRTIRHGRNVSLECLAFSENRTINYTWTKDGNSIRCAEPTGCNQINGNLNIFHCVDDDAGNYACVAQAESSSIRASAYLNVVSPPNVFIKSYGVINPRILIRPRLKIILGCYVTSAPLHTLSWFYNGEPIKPLTTRVQIQLDEKYHYLRLSVREAGLADLGYYQCFGENEVGSNSSTAAISLKREKVCTYLVRNVTTTTVTASTISLKWLQPDGEGGAVPSNLYIIIAMKSTQFKEDLMNEIPRVQNRWRTCRYVDGWCDFKSFGLFPNTEYHISFRHISHGVSCERSPETIVTTLPNVKNVAITNVTATTISLKWLRVSDGLFLILIAKISKGIKTDFERRTSYCSNLGGWCYYTIDKLIPNSEYQISFRSHIGIGGEESPITVTTLVAIPSRYLNEDELKLTPFGPNRMLVSWPQLPVSERGGAPILHYLVSYVFAEGNFISPLESSFEVRNAPARNGRIYTMLKDLKEDAEYIVWVVPANKAGLAKFCDESDDDRTLKSPSDLTCSPDAQGFIVKHKMWLNGTLLLTWTHNTSVMVDSYLVIVAHEDETVLTGATLPSNRQQVYLDDLNADEFYKVTCFVILNEWLTCLSATAAVFPGSERTYNDSGPKILFVKPLGLDKLRVQWEYHLSWYPDQPILSYIVRYKECPGMEEEEGCFRPNYLNSSSTSVTISNLKVFTKYEVSVRAVFVEDVGGRRMSGYSIPAVRLWTNYPAPTRCPDAIESKLCEDKTGVLITWIQHPAEAEMPRPFYVLKYFNHILETWQTRNIPETYNQCQVERLNLPEGYNYTIKVAAANDRGIGPFCETHIYLPVFTTSAPIWSAWTTNDASFGIRYILLFFGTIVIVTLLLSIIFHSNFPIQWVTLVSLCSKKNVARRSTNDDNSIACSSVLKHCRTSNQDLSDANSNSILMANRLPNGVCRREAEELEMHELLPRRNQIESNVEETEGNINVMNELTSRADGEVTIPLNNHHNVERPRVTIRRDDVLSVPIPKHMKPSLSRGFQRDESDTQPLTSLPTTSGEQSTCSMTTQSVKALVSQAAECPSFDFGVDNEEDCFGRCQKISKKRIPPHVESDVKSAPQPKDDAQFSTFAVSDSSPSVEFVER